MVVEAYSDIAIVNEACGGGGDASIVVVAEAYRVTYREVTTVSPSIKGSLAAFSLLNKSSLLRITRTLI